MKKLLLYSVLISIFTVSSISPIFAKEFTDVDNSNIFFVYIDDLSNREIVSGLPDGSFKPEDAVTRGALAKFVVKAFDLQFKDPVNLYNDLSPEDTFYEDILILGNLGIINGFSDGSFRKDEEVTRGAAMKFIVNAARYVDVSKFDTTTTVPIFRDVDENTVFVEQIIPAASIELDDLTRILNGYSDKNFGPNDIVTRVAMAKIVSQTIKYMEDGGTFTPPSPVY